MDQQTRIGCLWKYRRDGIFYYRGEVTLNGITTEVFMIPVQGKGVETEDDPGLEVHTALLPRVHALPE